MISNYKKLFSRLHNAKAGILTNQSAFGMMNTYHFEIYKEYVNAKYLFLPEHGLFAELQDQVSGSGLRYNYEGLEIANLYGDDERSLEIDKEILKKIDVLIIDIKDVGSRYYTYLTTAFYLLQSISQHNKEKNSNWIEVIVIDSPNPIGRKVEGSPLQEEFVSFVGVEGILHRHGFTPAELLSFYNQRFRFNIKLSIVPIGPIHPKKVNSFAWVPPSPNIPTSNTCYVYPGQCLLEGTNMSEGRGTTKPFEIFGAPYIDIQNKSLLKKLSLHQKDRFLLRPLMFMPTFHKHQNQLCGGYQLIVNRKKKFHSLLFSLYMIRTIREQYPKQFAYHQGIYEFRSNKTAIELLTGDRFILDYLEGKNEYRELKEYFDDCESYWKKLRSKFLLYKSLS
ncbi:MAG: DUF1343 domain-containing protein [Spirochaetota bacterium]